MANSECLEILKQGVEQWNRWRQLHQEIQPDLRDADLSDRNMSYADLSIVYLDNADLRDTELYGADLEGASLSGVYLHRADLRGAHLTRARLTNARLVDANLSEARLSHVRLSHADLRNVNLNSAELDNAFLHSANLNGADLNNANLRYANLRHATLYGMKIYNTSFAHLDLSEVRGLSEVEHLGPSQIELHSIRLPQDGSALHFLRGAGVPNEWIDLYRAQMMHPIQYHSCFISYAHQDNDLAHRLHADLQDKGVRCWFAPHDMHIGDKIRPRIDEAIHLQDKLLLILSEYSVASDWVEHEVETALARERRDKRTILFPIRLDDAILERPHTGWPALVQNERHIGDFTGWKDHDRYQTAFDRLIRDLKKADEPPTTTQDTIA